jgi:ribose-phosphate pyrophosphokinase
MPHEALLFALSESRRLGVDTGQHAGLSVAPLEERNFEDGELKLRPLISVRNRPVFVLQTLAASPQQSIAQRFVRLLFLLCVLRDGGASQITAIVPYLAYARKDRRTQPRDPIHTRYVAQLLEATGLQRLVALDVHNGTALDNAFRIGVDHLSALPMFVDHFATQCSAAELVVVSPDVGGIKRAQIFRELLQQRLGREIDMAFLEKRRSKGVVSTGVVIGTVAGRSALVLDDLCASGGTLLRAAEHLRAAGASAVYAAVTHAPVSAGLAALLAADSIDGVVTTDSAGLDAPAQAASRPAKLHVLPIAPLFGEVLARQLRGEPLAQLLERWPPDRA